MADKHFIVATAGHVDHGKSALVRALTGVEPDRLPEEKARGITIDLGFAQLVLPAPAPSTDTFRVGIIDVPGHEDFVKNMVAGVGSVDVGLLVVAADDGWMPQTEEHLQILTYLGVSRAVVALTKSDRVPVPAETMERMRAHLRSSAFEDAPIIATSTVTGQGIETLRTTLARILAVAPMPVDVGKPRLSIDRAFALRGIGTVVTGTLSGGKLQRDESVVAQPSGATGHVRTLQNHGLEVDQSLPGTRTALNLPDFGLTGVKAIGRGQVITLPGFGDPSRVLDVLLTRMERPTQDTARRPFHARSSQTLKDGTHVRVYHGTGAWTARVRFLDGDDLLPSGQTVARLRFNTPVFAFAGDRLILRDSAERTTLAGGTVLDPHPGRRPLRQMAQRRFLKRLAVRSVPLPEIVAAWLERDQAIIQTALLCRSSFSSTQINEAVSQLKTSGKGLMIGECVVDAVWWDTRRRQVMDFIDRWHQEHPEQIGPPTSKLRRASERGLPSPGLFDALLNQLVSRGDLLQIGPTIRRTSHQPILPVHLRAAGDRLRFALAEKPFEPPSRRELAPDAPSRQALRFLCDTGEAAELNDDLVLSRQSFQRMKTIITRTLRSTGSGTASELRQVLGTTRRVIIPLLEVLDREGLTRREGDRRFLK